MTFGFPDPRVGCPERQAFYPISVRQNKYLPPASFRLPVTWDTLAFDYEIPVITALSGLEAFTSHPLVLLHARHTHNVAPTGLAHNHYLPKLLIFKFEFNLFLKPVFNP